MPGHLTVFGATLAAAPLAGSFFLALGTGQSSTGIVGEPTGGGYARAPVTMVAGGVQVSPTAPIAFSATSISFPGLTHGALYTAATGGNCTVVGPLAAAVTLAEEGVTITADDLKLIFETAT